MNPYDQLDIEPSADSATIKRAYRRKAQKAHPDKGGVKEEFIAIQRAYALLSDESARKHFDETGEVDGFDELSLAQENISAMLLLLIEQVDTKNVDLVQTMKTMVNEGIRKSKNEIANLQSKIEKRRSAIGRIRHKDGGHNLMTVALEANIRSIERAIVSLRDDLLLGETILRLLGEYGYQIDIQVPTTSELSSILSRDRRPSYFQTMTA